MTNLTNPWTPATIDIMPRVVNLYEAKTHLSELVECAAEGEEILIAKAGKARARLVPLQARKPTRKPGGWKGKVWVAPDFDAPLPPEALLGALRPKA